MIAPGTFESESGLIQRYLASRLLGSCMVLDGDWSNSGERGGGAGFGLIAKICLAVIGYLVEVDDPASLRDSMRPCCFAITCSGSDGNGMSGLEAGFRVQMMVDVKEVVGAVMAKAGKLWAG